MNNKHIRPGFGAVEVIIAGVVILLIGGLAAYAFMGKAKNNASTEATSTPTVSASVSSIPTVAASTINLADAKEYAAAFYISYIAQSQNKSEVLSQYGTAKLVDAVKNSTSAVSPVLCSQNVPTTVVASSATVTGETAKVITQHVYTSGNLEVAVGIVKVNGLLKVDTITCPNPATGKQS